ncbi:MAG TPA: hypothetical protein PKL13_02180 [bacterium]|nr:hypothetical protein [bacterium]
MKKIKLREQSIMYSFFAFLYIVLVAFFMSNASKLFGNDDKGIIAPIAVLLLLVLSVAIMGMLIFGKAAFMFLDGEKKDVVKLVIYNIVCLFIMTTLYFGILFFTK